MAFTAAEQAALDAWNNRRAQAIRLQNEHMANWNAQQAGMASNAQGLQAKENAAARAQRDSQAQINQRAQDERQKVIQANTPEGRIAALVKALKSKFPQMDDNVLGYFAKRIWQGHSDATPDEQLAGASDLVKTWNDSPYAIPGTQYNEQWAKQRKDQIENGYINDLANKMKAGNPDLDEAALRHFAKYAVKQMINGDVRDPGAWMARAGELLAYWRQNPTPIEGSSAAAQIIAGRSSVGPNGGMTYNAGPNDQQRETYFNNAGTTNNQTIAAVNANNQPVQNPIVDHSLKIQQDNDPNYNPATRTAPADLMARVAQAQKKAGLIADLKKRFPGMDDAAAGMFADQALADAARAPGASVTPLGRALANVQSYLANPRAIPGSAWDVRQQANAQQMQQGQQSGGGVSIQYAGVPQGQLPTGLFNSRGSGTQATVTAKPGAANAPVAMGSTLSMTGNSLTPTQSTTPLAQSINQATGKRQGDPEPTTTARAINLPGGSGGAATAPLLKAKVKLRGFGNLRRQTADFSF
jgi:hypothetical protein